MAAASRILGALDDVPAHVIPARPRVAPAWYRRAVVRAAAGFVIVAAGSLWATRSWRATESRDVPARTHASEQGRMRSQGHAKTTAPVVSPTTPAPSASVEAMRQAAGSVERVAADARSAVSSSKVSTGTGLDSNAIDRTMAKRVASPSTASVAPAPAPSVAPAAKMAARAPTFKANTLSEVTTTALGGSRAVSVTRDSVPQVVRHMTCDSTTVTEYTLSSGSHVTLFESASAIDARVADACVSRMHPNADEQRREVAPAVLTWTSADSTRHYMLRGLVPADTLTAVRTRLGLSE